MDVEGNRSAGSTSEPTLVMEDVSFSYANGREGAGVRRVDRHAASGEVVLLCGPAGCGQTTLTRLANGLAPHYYEGRVEGRVRVGGLDAADHPLSLSGGQKQRTCIASALASEREVIVYDEPTSGLDLHRMRQVARLIHDVRRRGAAQLVITHDPEFIMACCSWVVRLEDGGIMESYPLDAAGTRRLSGFFMHEGALDEKP